LILLALLHLVASAAKPFIRILELIPILENN